MARGDRVVLTQNLYTVKGSEVASMPARVEREVQDELYRLGCETRDLARSYCPVKTGALKASVYVTRGAGSTGSGPFTRQSTEGYFRAINSAIRRGVNLEMMDQGLVDMRTQRPIKGVTLMRTIEKSTGGESAQMGITHSGAGNLDLYYRMSRGISTIGGRSFASYSGGGDKDVEHMTPKITEMGAAGRASFFVSVGAAAHYAGDVEFGHVIASDGEQVGRVEARPFMRPALAWAKSQLSVRVSAAFKRGLAR